MGTLESLILKNQSHFHETQRAARRMHGLSLVTTALQVALAGALWLSLGWYAVPLLLLGAAVGNAVCSFRQLREMTLTMRHLTDERNRLQSTADRSSYPVRPDHHTAA